MPRFTGIIFHKNINLKHLAFKRLKTSQGFTFGVKP